MDDNVDKSAIPEARPVKRKLLQKQDQSTQAITRYNQNRTDRNFEEMRNSVVSFYYSLQPHLLELENTGADYSHLHELKNKPEPLEDCRPIQYQDEEYWKRKHEKLQKALYDLGVTKIAIETRKQVYGYSFLNGLDHDLHKEIDPGWKRLKENASNMKRLLKQDTDIVGLIYGGNRTGKTTLSLQLARLIDQGENEGKLQDNQIIFNDEDFREAMKQGEQYQANHIDEMKLLFSSRDAMTKENKTRNKFMSSYAKKNMAILGCDNNFYNIDKQFRSDKIDFVIHVPERGRFEFYSEAKVRKFEKNDEGYPRTPEPDFTGEFPDMDPLHKETDPLWKQYQEVEDKKLDVETEEEEEEDNGPDLNKIKEEIVENLEDYTKTYNSRKFVDKDILSARFDIGKTTANKVKKLVESETELPKKLN